MLSMGFCQYIICPLGWCPGLMRGVFREASSLSLKKDSSDLFHMCLAPLGRIDLRPSILAGRALVAALLRPTSRVRKTLHPSPLSRFCNIIQPPILPLASSALLEGLIPLPSSTPLLIIRQYISKKFLLAGTQIP